jgi:small subunit ribosomal protein S6
MANRVYEMMYIAAPTTANDDIEKFNDALGKIVEGESGTVTKVEDMGVRKLAYKINKLSEGRYVLFEIEGSGREIAELERRMRVNDAIIRYITVRVDEDRKKSEKIRSKRENRTAKRRAAASSANSTAEEAEA